MTIEDFAERLFTIYCRWPVAVQGAFILLGLLILAIAAERVWAILETWGKK